MELQKNQAAIILEASDEGEISVNIEGSDEVGLAYVLCRALAKKILSDEAFQAELLEMIEESEEKEQGKGI
ncbi:MAG: twitching motility protein [Proteobacteria bacterium]|nr:twitching motility protein [Pseudomonadota bacterium]